MYLPFNPKQSIQAPPQLVVLSELKWMCPQLRTYHNFDRNRIESVDDMVPTPARIGGDDVPNSVELVVMSKLDERLIPRYNKFEVMLHYMRRDVRFCIPMTCS